jgi:Protein of unknown function (DUF2950)
MKCPKRRPSLKWRLLVLALCLIANAVFGRAQSPQTYSSPDEAMKDLIAVARAKDRSALVRIFGADVRRMLSGDLVAETNELERFALRADQKADLVNDSDSQATIEIGDEGWPFPVPLVKTGTTWAFDTRKGVDELLKRRIGRNELNTMILSVSFAVAQWDYFLDGDWNSDGIQEFAQKFISSPGKKDGLYWPTSGGEAESPLGPLAEAERSGGYSIRRDAEGNVESQPVNGYYVKMLKGQGPSAVGGRYGYVINGHQIAGFAMVAYPAVYGSSGVMTFIVNQQGRVYHKDLGPSTATIANAMTVFDPAKGWTIVNYQQALDAVID